MSEKRDPPIQEQEWVGGVKVVDIGDYRVSRGISRRPFSSCRHLPLIYDQNERRIWCKDCERDIEPFDAFLILVEQFYSAASKIEDRERRLREAEEHSIIRVAAKRLDDLWRKKQTVPACPHCHAGLLPEDAFRMTSVSAEIERARRNRKAKP